MANQLFEQAVKAAFRLNEVYERYPSMLDAVGAIRDEFPQLEDRHFIPMWIGMNVQANHHKSELNKIMASGIEHGCKEIIPCNQMQDAYQESLIEYAQILRRTKLPIPKPDFMSGDKQ